MGKATRGIEISSLDEVDQTQLASWKTQITPVPGSGDRKKRGVAS